MLLRIIHGRLRHVASRLAWLDSPILQIVLEHPSASGTGPTPSGVVVQGYVFMRPEVLSRAEAPVMVGKLDRHTELVHPLDLLRPDVATSEFQHERGDHPRECRGFRFVVPLHMDPFDLDLRFAGKDFFLTRVSIPKVWQQTYKSDNVLAGDQGWLFLVNDANNSVGQHCGALQLTQQGLRGWQRYARGLQRYGRSVAAPAALLLSPTKESVIGQFHPTPTGDHGPAHQLRQVLPPELLVHPVEPLAALGDESFTITDTHCSDRGAMVTSVELAAKLGLSSRVVRKLFANDRYRPQQVIGDLGCKLTPVQTSIAETLDSYDYREFVVYDNGLRNYGRIVVTRNADALMDKTCLIFGSSSSYLMLNYVSRIFGRVVLVHTAGNLDPQMISAVKPHFLATQTNARFVVRVPILNYCVRDHLTKKLSEFSDEDRNNVRSNQLEPCDGWLAGSDLSNYHQLVSAGLQD